MTDLEDFTASAKIRTVLVLSGWNTSHRPVLLCNREALFLCSSVALILGQHLKLATGLFVVADQVCFRGSLSKCKTKTLQFVFTINFHDVWPSDISHYTHTLKHSFAYTQYAEHVQYVLRLLCVSWGQSVCGPVLYKLVSIQFCRLQMEDFDHCQAFHCLWPPS